MAGSLQARVGAARRRLRDAGIAPDEADIDARVLAEHLLGWTTERFLTEAGEAEPDGFAPRFEALVARRASREPLAYIVGHREFWGLDFEVTPAALVPRPETELLVEIALDRFPNRSAAFSAIDVGAGSGCLAVAIARERSSARVVATDLSHAALAVARRNAGRHGVADRVTFVQADLFDGVAGAFDLIVANPPYVPERDRATIPPEVRDYEPATALFAGEDGLAVIRRLVPASLPHLAPGGLLAFEFGFGQAGAVEQLISTAPGLTMIGLRADLQGIPRAAVAQRLDSRKS